MAQHKNLGCFGILTLNDPYTDCFRQIIFYRPNVLQSVTPRGVLLKGKCRPTPGALGLSGDPTLTRRYFLSWTWMNCLMFCGSIQIIMSSEEIRCALTGNLQIQC